MALNEALSLMADEISNEEVQGQIVNRVVRDILGGEEECAKIEVSTLSANYFSFTFSIKVETPGGRRDVYVKIPKVDMRGRVVKILPITSGDRTMAEEEEASLRLLCQEWDSDDLGVRWVSFCGIIPEYNAIVTDRVFADEAVEVFRRLDLRRRLGFGQDAKRLEQSMARAGAALGRFHRTKARTKIFRLSESLPKLEFYCHSLAVSEGYDWPDCILVALRSMGDMQVVSTEVPTLKGIDIRNVLMDKDDGLYFLDPGKMKITYREADLARFLMTYRILYWGSKLLPVFREPDPRAEAAFLEAYYANSQPGSDKLLGIFLLKEQLKHWYTALDSLQRLSWSPTLKRLVAKVYVNPFYKRQIAAQIQTITK